jgi:hypothetical protein
MRPMTCRHITQVGITDLCVPVPGEHRVYRFGELGTARLVDAASAIPRQLKSILNACFRQHSSFPYPSLSSIPSMTS